MTHINILKDKILSGERLSHEEALSLEHITPSQYQNLWDAATEITDRFCSKDFDSCSIINARSGKCSENCKWCAQSAHFNTNIEIYPLVDREECMRQYEYNKSQGIKRFSLVTSGRKMSGGELDKAVEYFKEMNKQGGMQLCASMGLLNHEELEKLYDAGVTRYHCNLEAAPSHFEKLCTTHSIEDKIKTINLAREIGFEVCSGGIIGMGETRRQRIELALELLRINPASIPINLLNPIPGTPLEGSLPLPEEEILNTIAIFRFIHPDKTIRFAGGRNAISKESQILALKIGMNGAIVGDLLTTIGSKVEDDRALVSNVGYKF